MYNKSIMTLKGYAFPLWGLAMHLVVLWGVLDANFHSPILQALPVTEPPVGPPAKRVFLFVADGLRYRTFIEDLPPFLRDVMNLKGVWGISHTRMPTESRPGNVAIAAGLYEDPSALFKGWKENPVDFDSIFNRSSYTWAWGSPDIIPMFAKSSERIHGKSYPPEWQNFDKSAESSIRLDTWVFDHFFKWLREEANGVRDQQGLVLYFHLLGCDTAGHTSKPYSEAYKENMKYVDRQIEKVVEMTEKYFNDNGTAYVFTSDHGMTDWGSHGSGSSDETETPLVAWGAGIARVNERQDIEQADITPFISSLLGAPIPVNNEGILPRGYMAAGNDTYGAYALRSNIAQLRVQVKANRIVCSGQDSRDVHWREVELDAKLLRIDNHLSNGKIAEAIKEGEEAILLCKESLSHYRRYQRNRIIFYLTLTWLGWIALLSMKLVGAQNTESSKSSPTSRYLRLLHSIFFIIGIVILIEDKISGRPGWRVSAYGIIALFSLWLGCCSVIKAARSFLRRKDSWKSVPIISAVILIICVYAGLTSRPSLAVGMVMAAMIQKYVIGENNALLWLSGMMLSIFPFLPVVGPQHYSFYKVLSSLTLATVYQMTFSRAHILLRSFEIARQFVTALVVSGIIDGRSFLSWIILITAPVSICLYPKNPVDRFLGVVHGLLCPYVLLSASHEPYFYLVLATHLVAWPSSGNTSTTSKYDEHTSLTTKNIIRAAFYMLHTLMCFFGTGNMASISSFDPTWTRHFVTIFSPFTMAALILLKLTIPLVLVGCATRVFATSSIFHSVLLLGDCVSLPLMYGITAEGSWLDIGSAISRYTIAIAMPCLLLVLYYISQPLMSFSLIQLRPNVPEKKHLV